MINTVKKGFDFLELSGQLKKQRQSLGLTQQALADQLHVTRQTVSRWENGSTYPNLDTLVELSERLSISLDKLLKSDEIPVVPIVHQISRDVRLKRCYWRWLTIIIGLFISICLIGGVLSWGHYTQNAAIDRLNPLLTTRTGYAILPEKIKSSVDVYVSDDPFGNGEWLKLATGQRPTMQSRWVLVRHKGSYVSGVRLVTRQQIPVSMREQAGSFYTKYDQKAEGPCASWQFWN